MPRRVQRIGDFNYRGGMIVQPNTTNVFANFKLVAAGPCLVSPHIGCPEEAQHCAAITLPLGVGGVFINGLPVVAELDTDSCGDQRMLGSSNVFIGP